MSTQMSDRRLSIVVVGAEKGALVDATLQSAAGLGGQCLVAAIDAETDGPPQAGPGPTTALELPLRIERVEHRWADDFAACRNAAMQQAEGDWLLWLEAGEIVPPAAARALTRALQEGLDPQCGYHLLVRGSVHDGGSEQVCQLRLHARRADLRFVGRVRERLMVGQDGSELRRETLAIPIVRGAALRQPGVLEARAKRKVRLAQKEMAERGELADLHNGLGEAYLTLGRIGPAAHHFRQALQRASCGAREQLEAYYGLLTCLDALGPDRHAQLSLVLHALETFSLDAQLLVALGGYLRSLDYLPTAARAFDVAFRQGQVEPRLWHFVEIRELAAACGASTYLAMNRPDSALHLLEAAWRMSPTSRLLARELAATYRRLGRVGEAQRLEAWLKEPSAGGESDCADEASVAGTLVRVDPPGVGPLPARPAVETVERWFPSRSSV